MFCLIYVNITKKQEIKKIEQFNSTELTDKIKAIEEENQALEQDVIEPTAQVSEAINTVNIKIVAPKVVNEKPKRENKVVNNEVKSERENKKTVILAIPKLTESKKSGFTYKVIVGSFNNRENAKLFVSGLKAKKVDSYIWNYTSNGQKYFRVQVGAFKNYEEALRYTEYLKQMGITGYVLKK